MIYGIGTDIIKNSRIKNLLKYPEDKLLKIFSKQELEYCNNNLEKLAARFAAKESFYKALSATLIKLNLTQNSFSLIFTCQNIEIINNFWGLPEFKINWKNINNKIGQNLPEFTVNLSISHEKEFSIAFVTISI